MLDQWRGMGELLRSLCQLHALLKELCELILLRLTHLARTSTGDVCSGRTNATLWSGELAADGAEEKVKPTYEQGWCSIQTDGEYDTGVL